jgi:hypothetical protein
MSPSRSFLINTKRILSLFLMVGCTHRSSGIYRAGEKEPFLEVQSYFTPHDKSLRTIVGGGDPLAADPRRVFEYYCSSGRSQRSVETTIRAVLPRQPKGVPIDVASQMQESLYQLYRGLIKKFYQASFYEDILDEKKRVEAPPVFGLRDPSSKAFVSLAKESRANEKIPLTLLALNGSGTLIMGTVKLPVYSAVSYEGSEKGLFKWRETDNDPPLRNAIDVIFPERPMRDEKGQVFYPIYTALPFEVIFFRKYFTMLIPDETQRQLFNGRSLFIRDDGTFDLGQAVERRELLWNAYVESQTSLKEAQTDDPQVVDFQVKLEMDLFCRYGRVVSDLLTN